VVFTSALAVTVLLPILRCRCRSTASAICCVVYLLLLGTFFLALAGLDPARRSAAWARAGR